MEQSIIIIAFFLLYFNISGLATTNIIRLTAGNDTTILSSKCVCGNCGKPITAFYQLPIISYILCKGRCKECKVRIPTDGLVLEITVLLGMFMLCALMSFSFVGVTLSFVYYELVRVVWIIKNGKRDSDFVKQYVIAVLAMIPYYLITLFVAFVYKAVCL